MNFTNLIFLCSICIFMCRTYAVQKDAKIIEEICDFTISFIDKFDDISDIECGWENAPYIHNFYINILHNNKEIFDYIYGDAINKIFEQYQNDRRDDCIRIALLNKRLIRHFERFHNKNC